MSENQNMEKKINTYIVLFIIKKSDIPLVRLIMLLLCSLTASNKQITSSLIIEGIARLTVQQKAGWIKQASI